MLSKKSQQFVSSSFKRSFSPMDAVEAFNPDFMDEDFCRKWIINKLYSTGIFCPNCKIKIEDSSRLNRFYKALRIRCPDCQKSFTCLTDTFFLGTQFNFSELYLVMFLIGLGFDNQKIATFMNRTYETIRMWRLKIDSFYS